jgi:hypothetical protein
MKEHLKRKWKQIHSEYKSKKSAQSTKPSMTTASVAPTASTSTVTLPYIPGGRVSFTTEDSTRDMMIEKFIGKL